MLLGEMKVRNFTRIGAGARLLALLLAIAAAASAGLAQTYVFNRADFATGMSPQGVVSGDFNGDGRADLAVAITGSESGAILVGTPSGAGGRNTD